MTSALVALMITGATLIWIAGPVNQADDAAAFAAALLGIVALPVSLATAVTGLFPRAKQPSKSAIIGAVAFAGAAGTGPLASIMVADGPRDPIWIAGFAWSAPLALVAASVLAGVALFGALRGMGLWGRLALTVPLAIVSASVAAFAALQMMPALLASVALPIVLVVMWRGRKRREIPTIM